MTFLLVVLVAAIIFLVGALWLARRRMDARIQRLRKEIAEIAGGGLFHERVSRSADDDELAGLEDSVNAVFEAAQNAEREQRERDALFQCLAERVDQAVVIHRESVAYANPRLAALRGVRQSDLENQAFVDLVQEEYRPALDEYVAAILAGEKTAGPIEAQMLDRNGNGVWVRITSHPTRYQGQPAVMSVILDISHHKALEATLEQGRIQTRVTLESVAEGVITTDGNGKVDYINSAAEKLTGVLSADALGRRFNELVSLVDEGDRRRVSDPVRACLSRGQRIVMGGRTLMLPAVGDAEIPVEMTVSPIHNLSGDMMGVVIVLRDVSELRGLTRQMTYQASHDPLTGLINRREFENRIDEAQATARAGESSHVLCYLDLDRFKVVNDTCGHSAGDNLLREVAGLIKEKVRDSDSVGRLGGDEFGMLLVGCPLKKARQIADEVLQVINAYRFVWRDKIFTLGVSIGLVEIGLESGSREDIIGAADSACYIAKQSGRGQVHVYSSRDEAKARHRGEILWLQRLQGALKEDRFELYTQTILSMEHEPKTGPGVEVLLRLRGDDGADVSPYEFMQSAERYQLMPQIDRWVVQTTLAALGRDVIRLPHQRSCAINLSGQTLGDEQFLEFVVDCLDHTGVSPNRICFEVTEASVVDNLGLARRFIAVLHGMGCEFALDDFGSGIGSFANLKNLSIDYLKIDGSYTRDLAGDSVNQAMVAALIKLSRTLRFQVVAEQVESDDALETVRDMGVDFIQGYAVGRPRALRIAAEPAASTA
jgi:diguanylate cyclase (GGDEF)-like protein/PAS domain S-box-containing protein